jgi:predicted dienelactone hydrolase
MRFPLAIALVAGCSSTSSSPPSDPGDPPDGSVTPPPPGDASPLPLQDPAVDGPYKAGVRTIELRDASRNRKFSVDVWYPAQADGKTNRYELESIFGPIARIDSPARRDATPLPGSWPLVVFSHGFGGIRFQSYFLTERLATHGFVVVAPDHPGNTLLDFAQLGNEDAAAQSAIDRPLDVLYALDAALAGQLGIPLTIDAQHVATTGHSFGGWTSLETARRDSRIRAAFPLAPGFRNGATDDFVATLARPLLFVGGSLDETCEFPANQQDPYNKAQPPKYLLEVINAGHLDFSNLCEVPLAKQFIDDGCDETKIDPAVVQARTNRVATAFALRYLRDDPRYDAALDAAAVTALGNVNFTAAP